MITTSIFLLNYFLPKVYMSIMKLKVTLNIKVYKNQFIEFRVFIAFF